MENIASKVDHSQFWLEAELLEKLHYRNKNQHITTCHFKKFIEVRRQIQKLKQVDTRKPLSTLLQSISRSNKVKKIPLSNQLKNLIVVNKKEEAEVGAEVDLFVLVLGKLVASHRLLQNILHLTIKACKEYLRLMGLGTFLPFGLLCFGCLSRLHFLSQHYLINIVDSYNMCYQQARRTIPYSHLKSLPPTLVLPKFHGKSKMEEAPSDDIAEDLGDYLGGGGGLKKEALEKLAQISKENETKLEVDEGEDEGQAYHQDQDQEGMERELEEEEALFTNDPLLESRPISPVMSPVKETPAPEIVVVKAIVSAEEEKSDSENEAGGSPIKRTAAAPSKNFWLSQAIAPPSPKLQNLPKKVGSGNSKVTKPSKPAKPTKALEGKSKHAKGGNEIDSIFGSLE